MKNKEYLSYLEATVQRKNLSSKATERFEDTYKMLGLQEQPIKNHSKTKHVLITSISSLAACMLLLFGTNFASPAFAESLPIVGTVFQQINDSFKIYNGYSKNTMGTNVGTYNPQDINVAATSKIDGYSLKIEKASSDGEILTFSMKLSAFTGSGEKFDSIYASDLAVSINGIQSEITTGGGFYSKGNDIFTGTLVCKLPEKMADKTEFTVDLVISALEGKDKTTKDDMISLDAAFDVSFSVTANTSFNKLFALDTETNNGMKLLGIESTPIYTKIKLIKPYWGDVPNVASAGFPALYTIDGTLLPYSADAQEGSYDAWATKEQICTVQFDGVPSGTRQLVLRFYRDYNYLEVLSEFTIDLMNQSAVPSKTYEDNDILDINNPFNYASIYWNDNNFSDGKAVEYTNNFGIQSAGYSINDSNRMCIRIETPGDYKELKVEAFVADGNMIGSTVSQYGTKYENENWFWDETSPFWEGYSTEKNSMHSYRVYITPENYKPAWNEKITIKISDNKTGKEILSKDILLSQRDIRD